LREFIGQEGRAPVKGEPLKIGSIVNFNGQTLYVNCPYGGGVLINSDGSLDGKRVSLHPFVEGIISGYAIVKRCDGFKIIKSGSIEHYFPSSMLD